MHFTNKHTYPGQPPGQRFLWRWTKQNDNFYKGIREAGGATAEGGVNPLLQLWLTQWPKTKHWWLLIWTSSAAKIKSQVRGCNAEAPRAGERGATLTRPARLNEIQGEYLSVHLLNKVFHLSGEVWWMSVLFSPWPPPLFHSSLLSALSPGILLNEIDTCRRGQLGRNNTMEFHMVISLGHSGIL